MSFDKTVIVSNASCLPEIAGQGAIYIDPEDAKDIKCQIENVLLHNLLPEKYHDKYQEQLKKYSGVEFGEKVIDLVHKEFL